MKIVLHVFYAITRYTLLWLVVLHASVRLTRYVWSLFPYRVSVARARNKRTSDSLCLMSVSLWKHSTVKSERVQ